MSIESAQAVLDFWFGAESEPDYGKPKKSWFIKSKAFDQEIRDRFLACHAQACNDQLDHWQTAPKSCLALLVILDQFSRNLFRNTPKAFRADEKALAIAKQAISQGFERELLPVQRWFVYLPFEHSENIDEQHRSLELWQGLRFHQPSASSIHYAKKHAEVIHEFGRFPHRNQILNRASTSAELRFLKQPGSSF